MKLGRSKKRLQMSVGSGTSREKPWEMSFSPPLSSSNGKAWVLTRVLFGQTKKLQQLGSSKIENLYKFQLVLRLSAAF